MYLIFFLSLSILLCRASARSVSLASISLFSFSSSVSSIDLLVLI